MKPFRATIPCYDNQDKQLLTLINEMTKTSLEFVGFSIDSLVFDYDRDDFEKLKNEISSFPEIFNKLAIKHKNNFLCPEDNIPTFDDIRDAGGYRASIIMKIMVLTMIKVASEL